METIALIDEDFRRISSGGAESVEDLFTRDAIYEGAYVDDCIAGSAAIAVMLARVIPAAISPFRQWPIGVHATADGRLVTVEYVSEGRAVWNGSVYRNRYAGIIRVEDGRIAHWREYYDPSRFVAAVGPDFEELVTKLMPPGGMRPKSEHLPILAEMPR